MSKENRKSTTQTTQALMIEQALEIGVDFASILDGMEIKTYYIPGDNQVPLHEHFAQDEIFYCVSGQGKGIVGDRTFDFSPGDSFTAPAGSMHTIESNETQCVLAILLPVNRIVCKCKNVSYIDIRMAMAQGARTVEDIQSTTGAGTGCGGCLESIKSIIQMACECKGVTVSKIVEAVQAGAKSLEDVSAQTGAGSGCGKCSRVIQNIIDLKR